MAVQFSPGFRLWRTKVCVTTGASTDLGAFRGWCSTMARAGAGMIMVSRPSPAHLEVAHQGGGQILVGVTEPADRGVRADVVQLKAPEHASNWPGRLLGWRISNVEQARRGLDAALSFFVVDHRIPGLTGEMALLGRSRPDMVWFVSGCSTVGDLADATRLGARRVWMRANPEVGLWSAHLRQVWAAIPGTHRRASIGGLR